MHTCTHTHTHTHTLSCSLSTHTQHTHTHTLSLPLPSLSYFLSHNMGKSTENILASKPFLVQCKSHALFESCFSVLYHVSPRMNVTTIAHQLPHQVDVGLGDFLWERHHFGHINWHCHLMTIKVIHISTDWHQFLPVYTIVCDVTNITRLWTLLNPK